jgi:hypothetical protein
MKDWLKTGVLNAQDGLSSSFICAPGYRPDVGVRAMKTRIVKLLTTTVAVGILSCLGCDPILAKGSGSGGGGGGKGGVAHSIGGSHMHMGGMSSGNFSRPRVSSLKAGKISGAPKLTHSGLASVKGTHSTLANHALNGKANWNHWGRSRWWAWNGGWGGWWGPVFWPYFYGDLLGFVLWPYGYYPFWFYGGAFVWDSIFWPGPYIAYNPGYYDVYGDYGYSAPPRRIARRADPDATGSTSDLKQSCGGLAPGVADLPLDRVEKTTDLNDEQRRALDTLKAANSKAGDLLKTSCPSEASMTPLGRLETVQTRLDTMIRAMEIVRTPLDEFYNSLNDEQRRRFAELGSSSSSKSSRRGSTARDNLAELCSRRTENFTQLPVQRIEQAVKPTQQQQDAFEKLKAASTEAANQLQASCPPQTPHTLMDRFDAVAKRLDAMVMAVKTVRPALTAFYSTLNDEQKARFNVLTPPQTAPHRQG